MGARILAAVDCLDALASNRQYRRALPLDEAIAVVRSESGKSYDPRVVEILARRYRELEREAIRLDGTAASYRWMQKSSEARLPRLDSNPLRWKIRKGISGRRLRPPAGRLNTLWNWFRSWGIRSAWRRCFR